MRVVIARYQEDLDWANGISCCTIYNKGSPLEHKHTVLSLPNVGREGHTYLYHIIENYDHLDDHTCFLQGNPFDHTPDLEMRLKEFEKDIVPYYLLSNHVYNINLCYDPTDTSLHDLLIRGYERVFGVKKVSHEFQFGAGAQFIVSKEIIRSRSKAFYENILQMMDRENSPPEGFMLERFWNMIFTHSE